MLLRGMVRMDMARRLNAHRVLSLALCSLVLVGWGAFADLRAELAQLKASQDQLLAERAQQQMADRMFVSGGGDSSPLWDERGLFRMGRRRASRTRDEPCRREAKCLSVWIPPS